MSKTIWIISDIEIGKKDICDDFRDLPALIKFIQDAKQNPGENILVFNGDTFDYLKMDFKGQYLTKVTKENSLWKTDQILQAYPEFFTSLQEFLKHSNNEIYFIIGNHDQDLHWPSVQAKITKAIDGSPSQVHFTSHFQNEDIHAEHGHQLDFFYKYNPKKPIKRQKLNTPFAHYLITKHFIKLKHDFPKEEKIHPRHISFRTNPAFKKAKSRVTRKFLTQHFTNPLNIIKHLPIHKLLLHFYHFGWDALDDNKFTDYRFTQLRKKYPNKKAYFLGHSHLDYSNNGNIITQTWREEYNMTDELNLIPKVKTYGCVHYQDGKLKSIEVNKVE